MQIIKMLIVSNNLNYSTLCKYFSKKQARLILNLINNSTDIEHNMFLMGLNTPLTNKIKGLL